MKTLSTLPCASSLKWSPAVLSFLEGLLDAKAQCQRKKSFPIDKGGRKTKQVIYSNLCQQLFLRNSPYHSQWERDLYQQITWEEQTLVRQMGPVPQPALW